MAKRKIYQLVLVVPEAIRAERIGRRILEAVAARGSASVPDIASDLPDVKAPTLRYFLGKFQRTGVLSATKA